MHAKKKSLENERKIQHTDNKMEAFDWVLVSMGGLFISMLVYCRVIVYYRCNEKRAKEPAKELVQELDGQRILVDHRGVKHVLHLDAGQRESMSPSPGESGREGNVSRSSPAKLVGALAMDDVEASPTASPHKEAPPSVRPARNEAPPSARSERNAALPSVRREASLGKSDASLIIQKMTRGKLARGKVERLHLTRSVHRYTFKSNASLTIQKRIRGKLARGKVKLEAEQAIENAAREAREQLEAAMVMGVFVRRLLARRKGGKLKQQRLLKNPDHIDKAIMNGQGRAKLAEMREQKEKMNAYLTKMTC